MLLSIDNPVYNTIIVFSVIMLLLYLTKPDVLYNREKQEFRQFGTTNGRTLLPIYVVGILLAIILYVFFHYLSLRNKDSNDSEAVRKNITYVVDRDTCGDRECDTIVYTDRYKSKKILTDQELYLLQQQQIQQLQNQLTHLMQQQLTQQQMSQQHLAQTLYTRKIDTVQLGDGYDYQDSRTKSVLPNGLNI